MEGAWVLGRGELGDDLGGGREQGGVPWELPHLRGTTARLGS